MRCPYKDCPFEGTEDEVDDHTTYMASMGIASHDSKYYIGRR